MSSSFKLNGHIRFGFSEFLKPVGSRNIRIDIRFFWKAESGENNAEPKNPTVPRIVKNNRLRSDISDIEKPVRNRVEPKNPTVPRITGYFGSDQKLHGYYRIFNYSIGYPIKN